MENDVPLICDPVPSPRVLVCDRPLTEAEVARFKAEWERGYCGRGSVALLIDGARLEPAFDVPQWPDAEFCAA